MPHQSENQLEIEFISQLTTLGFAQVAIPDANALVANLKIQLEVFNQTKFTDLEFSQILNHLNKGDRFAKAKALRDRFAITRDDETTIWVRFFNMDKWCKNEYQVNHQINQEGKYKNRYDVTLLVNGLPLVQIELKKRGIEMKEAFNQVQRYHKHSFTGSLFEYIQIFVISNGVNTKYFVNNPKQSYEQTFYWTDENNVKITQLDKFAEVFLEKCAVSEMIAEYIILSESKKIPLILRPYQYYAVREIEKRVIESTKNGYIWHTTGSGKTLTSFKASQILTRMPEISKVLFVVDRKDLDIQTTKEFNSFSDGSVDGTNNTSNLVKQLANSNPAKKLVVTTIQKLDRAINSENYKRQFAHLANKKVVIIFDECHRSQFGDTHKNIKKFFKKAQLFGFTGTPIFADNNVKGETTIDVFEECLHKYIITHAISDNNVLGFAVEYVGKYTQRNPDTVNADIFAETMVSDIDKPEVLESPDRLDKIADYVLTDWKRKTKNGKYNALFAVSSVEVLKKYYTFLKAKKPENFSIATIFTYRTNEDESSDILDEDVFGNDGDTINQYSRDFLESCIKDYNQFYGTNYSTEGFYDYYKDLQKRIKNKEVDLVLVVNMFLTGFDGPSLNTIFVDKNLRYHGLIQAYSRTNRLLDSDKQHGNVVSFRNLKKNTDEALALFGDENAKEIVFKKPFELQKIEFEEKLKELKKIAPQVSSIDNFESEEQKVIFIKSFRDLLRVKSSLETFANFSFDETGISEQEFYDYQSKYLDIYESKKNNDPEAESILDQIDFELELTVRDVVNFDYIIKLIAGLAGIQSKSIKEKKIADILQIFDRDASLRKKKELIQKFIEENLPLISNSEDVENKFNEFWSTERAETLQKIAADENIPNDKLEKLMSEYFYTQKLPREQEIADLLVVTPKIMERSGVIERIKTAIERFTDIFEW